ncbi:phosophoadenylyl-sulfate reductase [Ramicandelaber brevisporus]|nr:phosophoadenylyl-sulfate reductase [Ramicandelaber brevisporus]
MSPPSSSTAVFVPVLATPGTPSTRSPSPTGTPRRLLVDYLDDATLATLNERLAPLQPQDILQWAATTIPGLFQTTAFGLTGLVALDMLSHLNYEALALDPSQPVPAKLRSWRKEVDDLHARVGTTDFVLHGADNVRRPPLIFIDTLHHFDETLELVERIKERYDPVDLHVYKPQGAANREQFAALYGSKLWETDELSYDYLVKVEPARRAYEELGVQAVITGRRRSQRGDRGSVPIIEVERDTGLVKLNPLAAWSFDDVQIYIQMCDVPYNTLLDKGYRSIGDYHSTVPTTDASDERSGRWQGRAKSECGLHKNYNEMKTAFLTAQLNKAIAEQQQQKQQQQHQQNQRV